MFAVPVQGLFVAARFPSSSEKGTPNNDEGRAGNASLGNLRPDRQAGPIIDSQTFARNLTSHKTIKIPCARKQEKQTYNIKYSREVQAPLREV